MDTDENKLPRDSEDRAIDECSPEQRRDKEMDKTLADRLPASDPPASQPECEKSHIYFLQSHLQGALTTYSHSDRLSAGF